MINLNEPNYYGVGKGFAQVIDTRGVENMYYRLLQNRMMQEQKDTAAINEMTSQYDPNKQDLRAEDIAEYNEHFTKWKSLYLNNRKLSRNPASNPELYKQAEELRSKMGMITKESKEVYHTLGLVADDYFKNRDKYDQSAVEKMNLYRTLPTSEIKRLNGGRLVGNTDFELDYQPVDDKAASAFVKKYALDKGQGYKQSATVLVKGDGANGLPLYENKTRFVDEFDPNIVIEAADAYVLSYPNELKAYNQDFKRINPEEIVALEEKIKTDFGYNMEIKSGIDLQHAAWITKYGKQWVEDKNVRDVKAKEYAANKLWKERRAITKSDQKEVAEYKSTLTTARQKNDNIKNDDDFLNAYQNLTDEIPDENTPKPAQDLPSSSMSLINSILKESGYSGAGALAPDEYFLVRQGKKIAVFENSGDPKNPYQIIKENRRLVIDPTQVNIKANTPLGIGPKKDAAGLGKPKAKNKKTATDYGL